MFFVLLMVGFGIEVVWFKVLMDVVGIGVFRVGVRVGIIAKRKFYFAF